MPEQDSIADDLAAGESLVLLNDLRSQPWFLRRCDKRLDVSTLHRWASRGCRGRRLEVVSTPTGRATTRSATLRFFQSMTYTPTAAWALNTPAPVATPRRRLRQIREAQKQLEAAGIC